MAENESSPQMSSACAAAAEPEDLPRSFSPPEPPAALQEIEPATPLPEVEAGNSASSLSSSPVRGAAAAWLGDAAATAAWLGDGAVSSSAPCSNGIDSGAIGGFSEGGASSSSAAAPPTAGRDGAEISVFEVNIKCIDNTITKLEVPSDLRGVDLKELIAEQLEAPAERQRLIFRGKVLKDTDTMGQHLTESGQTIHMVQRPVPPAANEQAGASSSSGAGVQNADGAAGPQIHFQFTTADGMPQNILQQVDLSQIFGNVFGAMGRGAGIGMVQPGPGVMRPGPGIPGIPGIPGMPQMVTQVHQGVMPTPPRPPTPPWPPSAAAGTSTGSTAEVVSGTSPAAASSSTSPAPTGQDFVGGVNPAAPEFMMGVPGVVQQDVPMFPVGIPGAILASGMPQNGDMGVQMPLQIVFQQGMGNFAQMLPAMLGEGLQVGDTQVVHLDGRASGSHSRFPYQGESQNHGAGGQQQSGQPAGGDALPWRDLRRLHQHLSRLLGRSSRGRAIPPLNMPGGELNTFLSTLMGAISQLGVAVSDLQAAFQDGAAGPQPRYRLQLAMALVAAARTLRGMATALQSGPLRGTEAEAEVEADASTDRPAPSAEDATPPTPPQAEATEAQAEAPPTGDPTPRGGSSESEAAPEIEAGGGQPEEEVMEVFLDPIQEVFTSQALSGPAAGSTHDAGQLASEMMQQLYQQMPQPTFTSMTTSAPNLAGVGDNTSTGRPAGDAMSSMPPEVAECWQRWTAPAPFRRVLEQAQQPAFSHAYSSGDSVSSRRAPLTLPTPEEFLPMRWHRAASQVEGIDDAPEPPEHLSRAYLSAFLRDLGDFTNSSRAFQDMPEASERFPHLSRYAEFFGRESAGASVEPLQGASGALPAATQPQSNEATT